MKQDPNHQHPLIPAKKQKRKEREIISFVYYNLQPLWLNLYFSFLLGWEWSLLPYINIGTSACNTRVIGTNDKHTLRKSCEECKKHNRNQTKWFTHGDHHRSKRLGTLFLLERNRWIIHILNTKPNLYSSRITIHENVKWQLIRKSNNKHQI